MVKLNSIVGVLLNAKLTSSRRINNKSKEKIKNVQEKNVDDGYLLEASALRPDDKFVGSAIKYLRSCGEVKTQSESNEVIEVSELMQGKIMELTYDN
jgi:hypothetical protein